MKKAFDRALAWLLVLGQLSWAMPVEGAPRRAEANSRPAAAETQDPVPQIKPNRRPPSVKPVPQTPVFSTWPTDAEIFRARVFSEPLVPIGATKPEENAALARALMAYQGGGGGERNEDLVAFLEGHQVSPWRASLQLNLGTVYRRTGYFTRALVAWEEAWGIAKSASDPRGRAVADRAAGELAQLHARLGNQERLVQLFAELEGRDVGGAAGELLAGAKRGLWLMQNQPERAFRCGPLAIDRILASVKPDYRGDVRLHTYPSTSRGTTLAENRALANEFGLGLQASHREDRASEVLVPALVHWKAGHFAALVKEENGRYLIQDPTFGEEIWVSRRALDDETSGYMLVREGPLPEGWRSVPDAEAETVRGKGATNESKIQNQKPCDHQSGGSGGCGGFCPKGLAVFSFHTMLVNLHITDTPVGYSPPRGPAVNLSLTYNQREAFQPQVFSYGNVGSKWNYAWQSYIEDDPTMPSQPVDLYVRGGGQETYTGYNALTQSYGRHTENRALVVRVSSDPVRYERRTGDGSVDVYSQPDGALTFPRKVFLTRSIDPQGNAVGFTYDASLRLVAVTDAIGQVTTLSYELTADPLKITKVTDPFGRFATLEYDPSGRLNRITDVIGMVSSFEYGAADFIKAMTTPYGTTSFAAFDEGRRRWLEATDPLGGTERLEYVNAAGDAVAGAENAAIPYTLPENEFPTGFYPGAATNYIYRNTFYWSKLAMARAPGKYEAAKLIHWLHTDGLTQTGGVIENEKEPLESMRTFYQYPDMAWQGTGSYAQPSAVGRVVEDGSSRIYRYEYNAPGKTTKAIDPLGRETVYIYGTNNVADASPTTGNGIDLLQVKQKNGAGYDLLWGATYNAQHRPLTVTDASGQTTTYTYNSAGQVLTSTTPARGGLTEAERTTTCSYDPNGYLQSVTGPVSGATQSYTYDGYGRIWTVTDADAYTLTYGYDALDRLTKVSHPDGTYEETVYNRLDAEQARDRLGRWNQTFHDALRRPLALRDTSGRTTTLQWCACGSLEKIIDPNGNATAWERDIQGRATHQTAPDGATSEWTYEDTSSRVAQFKDPKNQARAYQYFLDNTLKQVTYLDAVVATPTVSLTYDPAYRRLATVTDGTGTTVFGYHPVAATQLGAGALANVDGPLAGDTDKVSYGYDEIGQVARREVNGPASFTTQEFDPLYRTTTETNALGLFRYTYHGATGRLASISYPNGQTTTLDYLDNLGDRRLAEVHHRRADGTTVSKFHYDTSALGLITGSTQQVDAAAATAYAYDRDAADQLTAAVLKDTGASPSVLKSYAYGYDKAGNRTAEAIDTAVVSTSHNTANEILQQQVGGALRFAGTLNEPANVTIAGTPAPVSAANRFEGTASVPPGTSTVAVVATDPSGNVRTSTYQVGVGGEAKTFAHDVNGNLVSDGTRSYEWDAEDRLVAVVQGARRSEFTYNGLGQRVRIVEKDGAAVLSDRRYIWSDLAVLEERDATGSSVLRRFFHQGAQEGTEPYFYTRDHLGSIREMTDAAGAVRARYDYDPYGRQTTLSGDKDAAFGFTGHFRHPPSGLELAPYRAYDPSLGRWISQDPIGFSTADLNLYSYVSNGPIDSNDPTGQIPAIALLFTPPGLAALTAAGEWTLFVASAALVAIGLAEMTAVEDPPQALPPSTPTLPPPALPPAIPTTPSTPAMPMSQPTPAPPLPVPVPTTSPTNCPDPCDAFRKIAQAGATVQAAAWPSNLRTAKAREIYLKLLRFKGCADDGWNK